MSVQNFRCLFKVSRTTFHNGFRSIFERSTRNFASKIFQNHSHSVVYESAFVNFTILFGEKTVQIWKSSRDGPFALEAKKNFQHYQGAKVDDICVVVSQLVEKQNKQGTFFD